MNNMNKIQYILLLLALTLVGCHSYLNYNGPTEPEKLVLHCQWISNYYAPEVFLSHSFFMRQADRDSSYVNDATVEIRVGDGDWQQMSSLQWSGYYKPQEWKVPQPGERVEIRASHPDYESVSSVQYAPYPVEVIDGQTNGLDKNGLLSFNLTLSAYEGPETDVVGFLCSGKIERTIYFDKKTRKDTVNIETVYSLDPVFGLLNNLRSKAGYYGASNYMPTYTNPNHLLYLPTKALREPRTIEFYADYGNYGHYGNSTFTYRMIELFVYFYVGTEDFYRYNNSIRLQRQDTRLSDPNGMRTEDEYSYIEEDMNEIAYVLGGQEPVIIYNNIRGGIGHFTAFRQHGIYFD